MQLAFYEMPVECSGLLCGSADTGYLYQRIWLSVTVFTSVIFLCLVLVDDYLISFALLEDLSFYCISLYEWCAYDKLVTANSYDFVKYYCITVFNCSVFNIDFFLFRDMVNRIRVVLYIVICRLFYSPLQTYMRHFGISDLSPSPLA